MAVEASPILTADEALALAPVDLEKVETRCKNCGVAVAIQIPGYVWVHVDNELQGCPPGFGSAAAPDYEV